MHLLLVLVTLTTMLSFISVSLSTPVGMTVGVLAQEHGGGYCPVIYLSKSLDPVVQGMPACLHSVAASALLVSDAKKVVLLHLLTLNALLQVVTILNIIPTKYMTILCAAQTCNMQNSPEIF